MLNNHLLKILLALTLVPGFLVGQGEWVLEEDDGSVKVYVRPEADGDMSVRINTTAATSVANVKQVLDDCPNYPRWVHRCAEAYILPGGTADEFVYFSHVDLPFPFTDKEVVARITQTYDAEAGTFTRHIVSEPDAAPRNKGRDRLEKYDADWVVNQLTDGRVEITCTVRTSAGSGLPNWLRKEIMTGGPAQTVSNLVVRVEGKAR